MADLALRPVIPAMSERAIDNVRRLEMLALTRPQTPIVTEHVLHAGLYARTIYVPPGELITGALIKIPTLLILTGEALIYVDDGEPLHVEGYTVIPAAAGRKQAFVALGHIVLTMTFATSATTLEEAEEEFTDEAHRLFSRREA